MKKILVLLTLALLGSATGCVNAEEDCKKFMAAVCKKSLACNPSSSVTEADCVAELMKKQDCSKAVSVSDDFDKCLEDVEKAACPLSTPASCKEAIKVTE